MISGPGGSGSGPGRWGSSGVGSGRGGLGVGSFIAIILAFVFWRAGLSGLSATTHHGLPDSVQLFDRVSMKVSSQSPNVLTPAHPFGVRQITSGHQGDLKS